MNNCAYCNSIEKLTKEHIWPSTLIKKFDDLTTYNKANNKFYKGDAVIKDVCSQCNNVHLSRLDHYLSDLYDKEFSNILSPGQSAHFEFEYDKLLRVLLKISFNSARANSDEKTIKTHQKYIKYMLEGTHRGDIMLRLQIVTSSKAINTQDNTESDFRPEVLRCVDINYDGPLSNRFMTRMIAINSFWFFIVIPYKKEPQHKWKEFLEGFCNSEINVGIPIQPLSRKLDIPATKTTYFHPHLLGSLLDARP